MYISDNGRLLSINNLANSLDLLHFKSFQWFTLFQMVPSTKPVTKFIPTTNNYAQEKYPQHECKYKNNPKFLFIHGEGTNSCGRENGNRNPRSENCKTSFHTPTYLLYLV